MSIYFEKAQELGKLILESEQSIRLADAQAAYNADPEAQAMMEEYSKYQENIRQSMEQGALDQEQLKAATQRLSEMVHELKKHPVAGALIFAENEFNTFVNQIMTVFRQTLLGQEESSCGSGGCSSCAGCH